MHGGPWLCLQWYHFFFRCAAVRRRWLLELLWEDLNVLDKLIQLIIIVVLIILLPIGLNIIR